jgi:hypothetical protein
MSTVMKVSNEKLNQVELALSRQPKDQEILSLNAVESLAKMIDRDEVKGWEEVCKRAIQDSGLFDSEVADSLEMDKGQFSKTLSGGNLQQRRLEPFCKAVGNIVPIQVLLYRLGYEVVRLKSVVEKELEQEKATSAELRKELETITRFMRESRV